MGWFKDEIVNTQKRTETRNDLESREAEGLSLEDRNRLALIREHEQWIGDQMRHG